MRNKSKTNRWKKGMNLLNLTWATNIECRPRLLRNALAILGVGDREATAASIPLAFSAYRMPLACGYKGGISLLEWHSLEAGRKKEKKGF